MIQCARCQETITTGGIEPEMLMERLNISPADLEREIATLRHMEKVHAEMRRDKKYIVTW